MASPVHKFRCDGRCASNSRYHRALFAVAEHQPIITFDNVRHEATLHKEPDTSWNVEKDGLKSQEYGDPLVVSVVYVGTVKFFTSTRK